MSKLLYLFLRLIGYLPFWFWHGFADILWLLNYHIIGYRKKVVLENLKIAFPEKTDKERNTIARKFFRNFSDFIIESIKGFSMTDSQFRKRYKIENFDEVIDVLRRTNKGAITTAAHIFNWEWMISIGSIFPEDIKAKVAYTPLSNKKLNVLIKKNRERFGLELTKSSSFKQKFEKADRNELVISGLIADQSPQANYKFRTDFFGVNVPVFTGPETMAKRFDQSFWFLKTTKTGRSKYILKFELLSENPLDTEQDELTKLFLRKVEKQVRAYPDNYLWTHRRWKHRK